MLFNSFCHMAETPVLQDRQRAGLISIHFAWANEYLELNFNPLRHTAETPCAAEEAIIYHISIRKAHPSLDGSSREGSKQQLVLQSARLIRALTLSYRHDGEKGRTSILKAHPSLDELHRGRAILYKPSILKAHPSLDRKYAQKHLPISLKPFSSLYTFAKPITRSFFFHSYSQKSSHNSGAKPPVISCSHTIRTTESEFP